MFETQKSVDMTSSGKNCLNIDRTLHQFLTITDVDLITEFDFLPNCTRFP